MGISLARRHKPNQNSTALKHKPLFPPMHLQSWINGAANMFKNCGKYLILCTGHQHDGIESPQLNCCRTNKGNSQNGGTMHTVMDYLAHNVDAKIQFHVSDMILNIHSDTAYLSEPSAQSHACGHFFMGWKPKNGEPIRLNKAFHVSLTIMKFVVASAGEAELGAIYYNCQTGIIFRLTLAEMGHTQSRTTVHCNNATAVGVANNSIKRQHFAFNGKVILLGKG
jgi:hypothetical protein